MKGTDPGLQNGVQNTSAESTPQPVVNPGPSVQPNSDSRQ